MRKFLCITLALCCSVAVFGQKADLRKGNRQFKKKDYAAADISYRKALMQDTTSVTARYNLAGNLYRQENYEEAAKQLDAAKERAALTAFAADYDYNRGDVAIAQQDWKTAVEALQQCLLRNPGDLEAKENYIYARNKLMEQQGQDQNQNQDQNQDQNQNQNQDQDQNQDQQQNQDQNQDQNQNQDQQQQDQNQDQNQDKQDQQQQQQPQQQQAQLNPQQAQQLLQAIQEKEKQTQEKVDEKKAAALKSRQKEKNW